MPLDSLGSSRATMAIKAGYMLTSLVLGIPNFGRDWNREL